MICSEKPAVHQCSWLRQEPPQSPYHSSGAHKHISCLFQAQPSAYKSKLLLPASSLFCIYLSLLCIALSQILHFEVLLYAQPPAWSTQEIITGFWLAQRIWVACCRQKFEVYQNANMSPLTSGKTCYITKYFQRKPERKRRKEYELANIYDTKKKLIRHCYLETWILCSTNSFLFFKTREGKDQMMILLPTLCLTPLPLLKND